MDDLLPSIAAAPCRGQEIHGFFSNKVAWLLRDHRRVIRNGNNRMRNPLRRIRFPPQNSQRSLRRPT
jgi:hypothetical protein